MSVLRELNPHAVHVPRYRITTLREAIENLDETWVRTYEGSGVPIRGILSGRISIQRFGESSQLEIVINQIYYFFDVERENWERSKRRYGWIERNFAKNFYNAIISIKANIDWNRGAKPPVDRDTFDKLALCYEFAPFHRHWSQRQKRTAKRQMETITFYYKWFNRETQEEMRHQIDRDDSLRNRLPEL